MKKIEVGKLRSGEKFMVAEHEYIALERKESGVFSIEAKNYDGMKFGQTNNWCESPIRSYLEREYMEELIDNGFDPDDALTFAIDLKAENGSRKYGFDYCKVGLLTLEQYIKYSEYIPVVTDNAWWLG
jgi:hypothetical protein